MFKKEIPTAIHSRIYKQFMPLELRGALLAEGKTRLIYEIPNSISEKFPWGLLLFVAKDDVSTHNIVHETPLPWKGYVLTAFTVYGFTEVLSDFPHHLIAYGEDIYNYLPGKGGDYPLDITKRAIIVERVMMAPTEDVRRRYLCGSLYKGPYQRGEDPYGLNLPEGLPIMYDFGDLIYTPTAKSKKDEPLHAQQTRELFPHHYALGTRAFAALDAFFAKRKFVLVDGKLEMGYRLRGNALEVVIADEPAITPDNIRIARTEDLTQAVKNGVEPTWLGKENMRILAEKTWREMGINTQNRRPLTFPLEEAKKRGFKDYYQTFRLVMGIPLEEFWEQNNF